MSAEEIPVGWIRPLVQPYLRGYQAVAQRSGELRGYWFLCRLRRVTGRRPQHAHPAGSKTRAGFFVGYLLRPAGFAMLNPQPPECLVFAFVQPPRGELHRRLVSDPESLLRKTFAYIRWLTHRLPRFVFHPEQLPAMTRHVPMWDWPREKYEHYSRNFYIETLAWLVRSGLVRKLREEGLHSAQRGSGRRSSR